MKYEIPSAELLKFETEDVIRASADISESSTGTTMANTTPPVWFD